MLSFQFAMNPVVHWLHWRAYRKPPSFFRMVLLMTIYELLFPENRDPKCTPGPT